MTDNSDSTSRPQHPDAASTPSDSVPPVTPPLGEQPQAGPTDHSPYQRPADPSAAQPFQAQQAHTPPTAQQASAHQPYGQQPYAQPAGAQQTGAQPTAAYPTGTADQPTDQYARTDAFGAQPPAAQQGKKGSKTVPLVAAALAVGAVVGGASGAGIASLAISSSGRTQTTTSSPATVTVNQPEDATVITAAAATAAPSTVTVFVSAEVGGGSGSGVVVSDDGYIITNSHVVTLGGAVADPQVQVQTYDGRLLDAEIVGRDPIADIAVVKVAADSNLQPAQFADSEELNVGDTTIALGAPLGLTNSVSSGIVSALNRSITVSSSEVPDDSAPEEEGPQTPEPPFDFWNFDLPELDQEQPQRNSSVSLAVLQTDAAINQGNSGGALVNERGQVIGINVAIASTGGEEGGNIGLGFAIPSNLALRVAQELIEDGSASHGLLGASVLDASIDPDVDAQVVGASIKELVPGGAAELAGLEVGDIVTGVNGIPITSSTDLTAQIRALAGGSQAEIDYVRGSSAGTVDVTLGELG